MKKKIISLIVSFLIIIYAIWGLYIKNFMFGSTSSGSENREMAVLPQFNMEQYDEYASSVELYINDIFPGRESVIQAKRELEYKVFGTVEDDTVIIGKEGWLFYKKKTDGDAISCYKGNNLLTEDELQEILDGMLVIEKRLKEQNCEFVIFIAPNKERIYSEYMPDYYGEPGVEYAVKQIVDFIKENSDLKVVYPVEELLEAKEELGDDILLYHKTDTHWNQLGAYIGMIPLLDEVGIGLPKYNNSSKISVLCEKDDAGDLLNILKLHDFFDPGNTYGVQGYSENEPENIEWEFSSMISFRCDGADERKLLVCRDSFGTAMAEIFAACFEESYLVHCYNFNFSQVEKEQPDVFILEMVERYAPSQMRTLLNEIER